MSTILFFLPFILAYTVIAVYAERKVSAFIQDRYGPMETGSYGILQTVADLIKLLQKEDIVPAKSDKPLFLVAPFVLFAVVFTGFSVLPLTPTWSGAAMHTGVFLLLAIVSLDVLGIILAGWGSNNKYSLVGAMRSAAQIIAYEVPLTLSVLCVLVITQTLDLQQISYMQGTLSGQESFLFGIRSWGIRVDEIGGILMWNILQAPVLLPVWVIFFITTLAESNRAPFDLPEAESELVAGFQTEYSGFRWSVIMLSEYGMMLLVSILGTILFFGSWNTPLPNIGFVALADWTTGTPGSWTLEVWAIFWLLTKSLFFVLIQMWVRWTYPRVRMDQLLVLGWKYLTPMILFLLFVCGLYRLLMV
ncbi:complex I subunit 1/NuoH family protein [Fulvivirga sedimenti]|uniref:NADH-quinone oxidoreductase subunit H n=1 Tax=Fulvivirga sedimenti TaxID=2879465 RepID=A0A9X1KZ10_9BACT|nr:complex I subunit 1 family protein [Fulvivirga sedimenti]MCA6075400.1 NADH-quinone oxidoreductase subunit H [Fulvivirga sedimenti]MCA6076577.1 NADH-quinone oxidoreductase subunit H [Fulvivirga sedimenti]MCA6077705.1 NADH-quinone oxidoreductase subunit H [Fulvivirga sedimenti]